MSNNQGSLANDFTRALNLALKPAKIAVLSLGLLIGAAVAILFFWIGGLIKPEALRWLAWIIQRLGALIFGYVALASMCSVVAMGHAESTGERMGVGSGWALIARNITPVVVATLKVIIFFVASVAVIWAVGALGAIPEVGPILSGILIPIVSVAAGLFAIFMLLKLFLVSFVFPAVLCVTKGKGFVSYKESVRFIKGHIAHTLGRVALAVVACLVLYKIMVAGLSLTAGHTSRTMGNNRVTLRGSRLFDHAAGIPGMSGTAPHGFGVESPASPFRGAALGAAQEALQRAVDILDIQGPAPFRMKATQKVGGWIFSIILIVVSTVVFSVPVLLFSLSGYCAYMSFKDAPEIPLKAEAVDWAAIKGTAKEVTGKRKGEQSEKPAKGGSA